MSLELKAKQTALVLIDLERGIAARDLAPYPASDVVERCARLGTAVRAAGGIVVYVHVLLHEILRLPADSPMMPAGAPLPPPEASELVPEAGYQAGDLLITKRQWGAFHGTPLDQVLRRRGITTIVLAGIATNFGVESTARGAIEHGYEVVFAEDAMSTMSAELHTFAVGKIFPVIGRVRSLAEIAEAFTQAKS